ncbi:hypothetical protein Tco_0054840 [Tanacetum coccineum]
MTGDHSRLRNFVKKFIGTVRFENDHFGAIMVYGDYVIGDSVISRKAPEGGVLLGPERAQTYDDLNDNEKKRFDANVRATNIVLQGLPKDIYKLINHNIEAKAIWDNMLPSENINEYYVRFHKLVNDMRNIRMTMPNIQLNSKFVNNMSPEWDRFVTSVKLNKGLKETNHEQLYVYLKQHEKHAAQDRLIIERITPSTNDPLAFVSSVQPYSQPS